MPPGLAGIPAVYLSMIAVAQRHQGRGLGRFLLADALQRVVGAADQIGVKAVILDVIEDGGAELTERRRAFYAAMGFQSLPSRPLRMFISIRDCAHGQTLTVCPTRLTLHPLSDGAACSGAPQGSSCPGPRLTSSSSLSLM